MPKVQLGSPYKTKDNVLYVQFWKYLPNGKREKEHIRVGSDDSSCSCFRRAKLCAACKKKAQLNAAKIRETLTQVEFNPDASVTVRQFKQSFFAAKKQELNPSTIYNYETKQIRDAVRKHIADAHRDLASTLLIVASYTSLSRSELAGLDWETSILLRKIFRFAAAAWRAKKVTPRRRRGYVSSLRIW